MPYRSLAKFPRSKAKCTVYLLHFSKRLGHAQHYIGVTGHDDVQVRVQQHRAGRGARICKKAVEAGADLLLARVWRDKPRYHELRLKNRGGARKLCPICKAVDNRRRALAAQPKTDYGVTNHEESKATAAGPAIAGLDAV